MFLVFRWIPVLCSIDGVGIWRDVFVGVEGNKTWRTNAGDYNIVRTERGATRRSQVFSKVSLKWMAEFFETGMGEGSVEVDIGYPKDVLAQLAAQGE
jgi:hypothetical protein